MDPPREVFSLSWGRTSLDPLDRYTVGTAIKSASFTSQIVYTYIELFLSYKRLFTSTPAMSYGAPAMSLT